METITDFGLINLVMGVIRSTASDVRFGSGVVYEVCPVCFTTNNDNCFICKKCGAVLRFRNEVAEEFMETQWFEELMSVICKNPTRIKWLIRNRELAQRKKYE